jgi:hypothetical protein
MGHDLEQWRTGGVAEIEEKSIRKCSVCKKRNYYLEHIFFLNACNVVGSFACYWLLLLVSCFIFLSMNFPIPLRVQSAACVLNVAGHRNV